jgi:hypothetical protein
VKILQEKKFSNKPIPNHLTKVYNNGIMTCVEGVLGERTNIVEPELCYIDPEKLDLIWRRPSSALYVKMFEQQKREMPSEPLGTLKRTNIFLIMNIRNFIFGRRPGRYEGLCFAIKWLVLLSTI